MKRDVSTSTIGREDRKPLLDAYLFERRMLLACSVLFGLSLIAWIVAIATDHWIIISGVGGIFIPDNRRFFISSHSGLWRHCRSTSTPYALPGSKVARNFTSIAYQNTALLNDAKISLSHSQFIKDFLSKEVTFPPENGTISNTFKQRMFGHWTRNDHHFEVFKKVFREAMAANPAIIFEPKISHPKEVNSVQLDYLSSPDVFGDSLVEVVINSTLYYIVIPPAARAAIFDGWNEQPTVPKLFWPYVRDLEVPAFVINRNGAIVHLVPPKPTKKKISNGYEYTLTRKCKYIEMFPTESTLKTDPGFDDEVMDYIRTQASFACITVFVMCLGLVFSFYTFLNPRYMFKRLAGGIHFVSAATTMVVIQVLLASVDYTKEHLFYAYPDGAKLGYGYGVYLAYWTFLSNIFSGLMFMIYSGKKKGSKAPTDEVAMADEPINMGR